MNTTYEQQIKAISRALDEFSPETDTFKALNDVGSTIASLNLTKELPCKAADDIAEQAKNAFAILKLSDYSKEDLQILLGAAQLAYRNAKLMDQDIDNTLDIWCYRIRDAIKLKE